MDNILPVKTLRMGRFARPYELAPSLSPLQASPTEKVRNKKINPVVSKTGRLHSSHFSKVLAESLQATPPQAYHRLFVLRAEF